MDKTLTVAEIAQLTSFDHWRFIRVGDDVKLVRSLAKRCYLDIGYWKYKQPRDPITGRFVVGSLRKYRLNARQL